MGIVLSVFTLSLQRCLDTMHLFYPSLCIVVAIVLMKEQTWTFFIRGGFCGFCLYSFWRARFLSFQCFSARFIRDTYNWRIASARALSAICRIFSPTALAVSPASNHGEADRGHIHHCLQDRGLSRAQSLLVISALCVAMAAVTLVSAYFQNDRLALGLCLGLLVLLIVGRVFGYDETVLFFRYIQAVSALLAGSSGVFKTQLAVARIARSSGVEPIHHWQEITEHVEAIGGTQLEFICWDENSDAVICRLRWACERPSADDEPAWQFNYSVPGDQGVRATLTSRGCLQNRLKGQRLIDLFRLFDTFCRSWTQIALPSGEFDVPATILSIQDRRPRPPELRPIEVPEPSAARRAA